MRVIWGKYLHLTQVLHCPEMPSGQGMGGEGGCLQPTACKELEPPSSHLGLEADPAPVKLSDETSHQHNTLIADPKAENAAKHP